MPTGLPRKVRTVWRNTLDVLEAMDLLSLADGAIVERYARLLVLWREAMTKVERDGPTIEWETQRGTTRVSKHPALEVVERFSNELRQLEDRLGLSPSARTRLGRDGAEGGTTEANAEDPGSVDELFG